MITSDNITSHELIGLQVQLTVSNNAQIIGLNGKIVDETKFMFALNTKNGIKRLAKSANRWKFELDGKEIELDGAKLTRRPYERMREKS
jgi:ribonuclease P protein subunit POP4